MKTSIHTADPVLFGNHPEERIVAVDLEESTDGPEQIVLYFRTGQKTTTRREPFQPFMMADKELLSRYEGPVTVEALDGAGAIRALAFFPTWKDCRKARQWISGVVGPAAGAPFVCPSDPVQQYLMLTGRTLFKGMRLGDLRRMQLDIECATTEGYEFCNAERPGDRILAIGLSDATGWIHIISGEDEKAMLEELVAVIRDRDPDVLEGHNIFNFDLPYLVERARRFKVPLAMGRDGSVPSRRASRFSVAERTITFDRFDIAGRHVVDTLLLVHAYDVSHRSLDGFGLKDVAVHFGVAAKDRTYIDGSQITQEFQRDPERVLQYLKDDVEETRAISTILSASTFLQTQMLPFSYQNICLRGNAAKIDALLVREYLRQRKALPVPGPAREFAGGYTDMFMEGVVEEVHHCDVRSLYPSLMLTRKLGPAGDELRIFLGLLGQLRDFRLTAKAQWKESRNEADRNHWDALQSTFKILINSFYGYLGFAQGQFCDFSAAEQVTLQGRELLSAMIGWLREHGAKPVEIDTDGIYFLPPPEALKSPAKMEKFRSSFASCLPEGIDVEFDGEYVSMFSYKMKNYALLTRDGEVIIKGAALKSRGLEPFQRDFLSRLIRLKLEKRDREIPDLRREFESAIRERKWPITKLAKTEVLQDSLAVYQAKIKKSSRARGAVYELALRSGREYRVGDPLSYYIAGAAKRVVVYEHAKLVSEWNPDQRDENVAYYLEKLGALCEKFIEAPKEYELDFG